MITLDAISDIGSMRNPNSQSDTFSWNHTIGNGNLSSLIVGVSFIGIVGFATFTTTVTYNGVSMTSIKSQNSGDAHSRTILFYLLNPTVGTNSISVTISSSDGTYPVIYDTAGAISLFGVKNTYTLTNAGNSQGNSAVQTAPNVSVTSTKPNSWLISSFSYTQIGGSGPSLSPVSPQSQIFYYNASSADYQGGMGYISNINPPAATNIAWTPISNCTWGDAGLIVVPDTSSNFFPFFFT